MMLELSSKLTIERVALGLVRKTMNPITWARSSVQLIQMMSPAAPSVVMTSLMRHVPFGLQIMKVVDGGNPIPNMIQKSIPGMQTLKTPKQLAKGLERGLKEGFGSLPRGRLKLNEWDQLALAVVAQRKVLRHDTFQSFLKTHGIQLSKAERADLLGRCENAAVKLNALGVLKGIDTKKGPAFLLETRRPGITLPDAYHMEPLFKHLSQNEQMVAKVVAQYGEFNPTNLHLFLEYQRIDHLTAKYSREMFPKLEQAAKELERKGLLTPDIDTKGYTWTSNPTELLGSIQVQIKEGMQPDILQSKGKLDGRIAEILKTQSTFDRKSFENALYEDLNPKEALSSRLSQLRDQIGKNGKHDHHLEAIRKAIKGVDWPKVPESEIKPFLVELKGIETTLTGHTNQIATELKGLDQKYDGVLQQEWWTDPKAPKDDIGLRSQLLLRQSQLETLQKGIASQQRVLDIYIQPVTPKAPQQDDFKVWVQQAKQTDLVAYCRSQGYDLKKGSGGWHKLTGQNFGGLHVNGKGFHHFSTGKKGGAIDFVMTYEQKTFREAVQSLTGQDPVQPGAVPVPKATMDPGPNLIKKEAPKPFQQKTVWANGRPTQVLGTTFPSDAQITEWIEKRQTKQLNQQGLIVLAPDQKRALAYLNKTRGLEGAAVVDQIQKGQIKQDIHGNILFLGKQPNGDIAHINLRGTLDQRPFKGVAKGSQAEFSFRMIEPKSKTLVVTESPIDALSLKELQGRKGASQSYLALSGLNPNALDQTLKDHPQIKEIVFALDNDRGERHMEKKGLEKAVEWEQHFKDQGYKTKMILPKQGKDWNEVLVSKKGGPKSDITQGTHKAYLKQLRTQAKSGSRSTLLEGQGWDSERIEASYQRHLRYLVNRPNQDGLRYEIPALKDMKLHQAAALMEPLKRHHAMIDRAPLESVDVKGIELDQPINHLQYQFLKDLGTLGVCDQSGWHMACDQGFLETNYLELKETGNLERFDTQFLRFNKQREKGLGTLINQGLIESQTLTMPKKGGTYSKRVYVLTEKGANLLKKHEGLSVPNVGSFKKKASELRHELLTWKLLQNERTKFFLEGKKLISVQGDSDFDKALFSEMETLQRSIMKASGFSKEDLIRYHKLKGAFDRREVDPSLPPLSGEELDELEGLHQAKRNHFSPREDRRLDHLESLKQAGQLKGNLVEEHRHLSALRAKVEQAVPGALDRYAQLKKQTLPDLQLIVQEELVIQNAEGETVPVLQNETQLYEVDSGGGRGGSGGYSTQEILNKLENINGSLNYAVPGGIASSQGQKVAALIQQTQSRAMVISI